MRTATPTAIAVLATFASAPAAELPPELLSACRAALPDEMAAAAPPGTTLGSGAAGKWWIEAGQMDGAGSAEALLVVLPAGRPGEVLFFAEREGKDPIRKKVSLKGAPLARAAVAFHPFAEGRALAHVDGGASGQVLLGWNGDKLETIWKVGRVRADERHWFNLDDLDADGVAEVIVFFRRELDVFTNEDELAGEGGADDRTMSRGQIDAVAVHRWRDGRWKKSKDLLEDIR